MAAPSRASKRTQLQQRKASIHYRIRNVKKQLQTIRAQEDRTKHRLRGVEHQLRIARGQLRLTTLQLNRTEHELQKATHALEDASQELADGRTAVGDRLLELYEDQGNNGYLDLLLSSADVGDLLQASELAHLLMEQDEEALQDLLAQQARWQARRRTVQRKEREVATLQQRVAVWHNQTNISRLQVANNLQDVRDERKDVEAELAALERDSAAVTAMLRRLQTSVAGRRRYKTVYTGSMGGLPVAGRMTSPFGYRFHPVLHYRRMHTGVDIAARHGSPIVAAGGGEVISAGWRGGYGNTVIIDHGGGRATLYAHMSSIAVSAGQVVSRRQLIGRVGSTGISTGPHLHYEVRINGSPVNPL